MQEIAKATTTGRQGSFWFMFEPLLMSKSIFDSLTPDQQKIITEAGAAQEDFALKAAKQDDEDLATIFGKANVKISDFNAPALAKWRALAEETAWKDYAGRNAACAGLLKLAQAIPA